MCNTKSKRFYSPQFSETASVSVRRLAWALGKSMPATIDFIIRQLPSVVDPAKICQSCKDNTRCKSCTFCFQPLPQEQGALPAVSK